MPWPWGAKRETTPPATVEVPLSDPSGPLRFRIDDVYTITGLGCVVTGEVVEGVVRPPVDVRLSRGGPVEAAPVIVRVKSAMAHHQLLKEAVPGVPVGLQLSGVPDARAATFLEGPRHHYGIKKGDELVNV